MNAPVFGFGKKMMPIGPRGQMEQVVEKVAGDLTEVARQLDAFNGGTHNTEAAQAVLSQMRNIARMSTMSDMGQMNQMGGFCARGGSPDGADAFNPLSSNSCGSGPSRTYSSTGCDAELEALSKTGGGGGYFEDRVFALMIKIVEDYQKQIEKRLQKLQEEAKKAESESESGGGGGGGKDKGSESRNIEFEKIKFDMQKLSQMQQALSNILNTMDELAKSAIRHIKAG